MLVHVGFSLLSDMETVLQGRLWENRLSRSNSGEDGVFLSERERSMIRKEKSAVMDARAFRSWIS